VGRRSGGELPAEWNAPVFSGHARDAEPATLALSGRQRTAVPFNTAAAPVQCGTRPPSSSQATGNASTVRDGLLASARPAGVIGPRAITYSLFAEAARTGTPPEPRGRERSIGYILKHPGTSAERNTEISWGPRCARYWASDYPGVALRSMQRLGLLDRSPCREFGRIDSLVGARFFIIAI